MNANQRRRAEVRFKRAQEQNAKRVAAHKQAIAALSVPLVDQNVPLQDTASMLAAALGGRVVQRGERHG